MINGPRTTRPELSAEDARQTVDLSAPAFTTTADLEPLTPLVGQERAAQAPHNGTRPAESAATHV